LLVVNRCLREVGLLAVSVAVLFTLMDAVTGRAQSPTETPLQSIADTWQGTLHSGLDLRVVFKISKAEDGYKAVFYSIDQGLELPVGKTTLDGLTVKMTVAMHLVTYEGKLSPDGKIISGTWNQGPNPIPLILIRATPETAWAIPTPPKLPAMDPNASPAFEVATIKPSKPDQPDKYITLGRRFRAINYNLNGLIVFAYDAHPKQVIGAPAWAETDKFDIDAEPDREGRPSRDQFKIMVQKLLADRCKLAFHHEQKEMAVYVLTVGKTGPRLTKSLGNAMGLPGIGFREQPGGDLTAYNVNMGDFINFMTRNVKLDRPILDRTGIAGRYDFTLDWAPDDSQFDGAGGKIIPFGEGSSTLPSLYTAMQEQLGLRLEATRAPADVLVIEHFEKPSEN
jgi:uncharacterized protein (TIGR03435 family)